MSHKQFKGNNMHPATSYTLCVLLSLIVWYIFKFNIQTFFLISIVPILAVKYFNPYKKYKLPPGPIGLPIVGSLPWLMKDSKKYLHDCQRKYGPIYTLWFGNSINIVIGDHNMVKEFSNLPQAQDRPDNGVIRLLLKGKGIVDEEGAPWRHQRRFFLHTLRDGGMGKIQMDDKIMVEIDKMTEVIDSKIGKPTFFKELLLMVTNSVICNLAFGKRSHYGDEEYRKFIEKINKFTDVVDSLSALAFFPWLKPLFRKRFNLAKIFVDDLKAECKILIDEHRKNLDAENPRDFIDVFLLEMDKTVGGELTKEYLETFTEDELIYVIISLFIAGTETTSTTLLWSLSYMARHPEIQAKVQAEIDNVLGEEGVPAYSDKYRLPYTMATIQEVERLASVAPQATPRSSKVPINFRGYSFPANLTYMFNIYAVHRDPNLWKDPEVFNPERHIQLDGTAVRSPYLMPFGSGRRSCAAESLAKAELVIIFTSLMQKFSFKLADGAPSEIESTNGFVNTIHMDLLVASRRHR